MIRASAYPSASVREWKLTLGRPAPRARSWCRFAGAFVRQRLLTSYSEEDRPHELFSQKICPQILNPRLLTTRCESFATPGIESQLATSGILDTVTQDACAMAFTLIGAVAWVKLFDELAKRDLLEQKLSRKLVHISTGILFMLCWPLFSASPDARFFAALVPAANIVRLALLGLGITNNEAVVKSISRSGDRRELLRGPLYYVVAIVSTTLVFWRTSPVGAISLAMMCGGDGFADIVGRRLPSSPLPWNPHKSLAGSTAMFLFGSLFSLALVFFFCSLGFYDCDWWSGSLATQIALVAFGATVVESLPITDVLDDNLTVPLTAALLGILLIH